MSHRETTAPLASLASDVLRDPDATDRERSLAGSVLSQRAMGQDVEELIRSGDLAAAQALLKQLGGEVPEDVGEWMTLRAFVKPDSRLSGNVNESQLAATLLKGLGQGDAMIAGLTLIRGVSRG